MELSFVVIGYNEENNIVRTISSIYNLNLKPSTFEIIYIDSNSNDHTLKLLKSFPSVKIYKIKSNQYSAALSRFVGSNLAKGEILFFLDGDMEVHPDSNISFCLSEVKKRNIGVISGKLPEIWYKNNGVYKKIEDRYNVLHEKEDLVSPGGFFLIKKELINKVGNFNIKLKCNEEIELFARIKKIGLELYRTNKLSCIHHYHLDNSTKGFNNRLKNGFFTDFWSALESTISNKTFKYYIKFPGKIKGLLIIGVNFLMYLFLVLSLVSNPLIIIVPLLYYTFILIKSKFDYKKFLFNQKYNFYLILGFFDFLLKFKNKEVLYEVNKFEPIFEGEVENCEKKYFD